MPDHSRRLTPTLVLTLAMILASAVTLTYALASAVETQTDSEVPTAGRDSVIAKINRNFASLEPIFVKGCNDCHTNRTRYPWYYKLPGVKGMIDSDTRSAQRHLNLSSGFPFSKEGNIADDLVAIKEELKEGEMPPFVYRLMHWSAKPSKAEADSIYNWVDQSLKLLSELGIKPSSPQEDDSADDGK